MEQPITFQNNVGNNLFGILHIPENRKKAGKRIGVNILNPGLKNRVAPNRINVKIARMLCKKGFYIFRFDPTGVGDSEGHLCEDNENIFDTWKMIQQGAFVQDTYSSNSYFIETCKLDNLILIGQCGAGVTALLCGEEDHRIEELILIDPPFRIVSSDMSERDINAGWEEVRYIIRRASQAFLNPKEIKRAIINRCSWRSYFNTMGFIAKNIFTNDKSRNISSLSNRFNGKMAKAFEEFIKRNGKINFVFAENDFSLKEFSQDFKPNFLAKSENYKMNCKIDIIKEANHIYTEIRWQKELLGTISNWMDAS